MSTGGWATTYAGYDEATLEALVGAGPVRRAAKAVAAGGIGPATDEGTVLVVAVDGEQVRLDARGPAQAACSCPAPGTCRHVLAAVIWLRTQDAGRATAQDATAGEDGSGSRAAVTADPLGEVLALDAAALLRRAGVAAVRAARAADDPGLRWEVDGAVLVLHLTALAVTCRWVAGAGFDGMVSDVAERDRRALHLLALCALRSEHGVPLPWPDDRAGPGATAAPTRPDPGPLVHQVAAALRELVAGGLSHVTSAGTETLLAQTVSTRAVGLPRLAAQLRTVTGTLDLLIRRDHQADVGDALAVVARTHALCEALQRTASGADPVLRRALEGRARRAFVEGAPLELLPVGAHWWQTRGGARGLTLSCWDIGNGGVLETVVARPDGRDPAFTLHAAAHGGGVWTGSGPPAAVLHRSWTLDLPRMSDDGRLAPAGTTRASAGPAWRADDPRLERIGHRRWAEVVDLLRQGAGLAGAPTTTLLLRPDATRPPVLDEAAQVLRWEVLDDSGAVLRLGVPVTPAHRHRIEQLGRVAAATPRPLAVLTHVDLVDAATELVPVSVLRAGPDGALQVVALDLADEKARAAPLSGRLLRLLESRREARAIAAAPASPVDRVVGPVVEVLQTQAATGRPTLTARQDAVLAGAVGDLSSVGLATLADATRRYRGAPSPGHLLELAHLAALTGALDGLPGAGPR